MVICKNCELEFVGTECPNCGKLEAEAMEPEAKLKAVKAKPKKTN